MPISDEDVAETPFYRPPPDSPETKYLLERRAGAGRFSARAHRRAPNRSRCPSCDHFAELLKGSGTTGSLHHHGVRAAAGVLLRHKDIGKRVVPIIPDEARTFGMDALFREIGIYSPKGQLYEPVDRESLLYYHETKDGQILEEGITEAGAMSSFIAAGTAYANHGVTDDPVLHLLLDVRFPAHRRPDVAGGRHQGQGFPARRHRRPHHAQRRRAATSGRPQPVAGQHDPDADHLRPGLRLRNRGHHCGRHAPDVSRRRRHLLLSVALQRELPDAADARRRRRTAFSRASTNSSPARPARNTRPTSSAAARSSARRCARRKSWRNVTMFRPMSGAPPATNCSATTPCSAERWNMLHPTEPPRKVLSRNVLAKETGAVRRRVRQHEARARPDRAVGSRRFDDAGHGRLWPQRHARPPCAASSKSTPNARSSPRFTR